MKIKIYKSYGVLAHEKKPVYSLNTPASDIYDEITVDIPFPIWHNYMDEIGVTIDGIDLLLGQVLTNWGDAPAIVWFDGKKRNHIILGVVTEQEKE